MKREMCMKLSVKYRKARVLLPISIPYEVIITTILGKSKTIHYIRNGIRMPEQAL